LEGFWRKPTDIGEQFEEVPRRLREDSDGEWIRKEEQTILIGLEEGDQRVRRSFRRIVLEGDRWICRG
jgi:hypothetical protein